LSLVSADPAVSRLEDLSGRTVSVGDPGSSPDAVARIAFSWAGVKPMIVYSSTPEITRQFLGGRIGTAVLPEHAATLAVLSRTNARRIAEFRNLWISRHPGSSGIPQTALTARSDFLEKEGPAIRDLVRSYRDAVDWCGEHPSEAAKLGIQGLALKIPAAVLEKSIPHMNLVLISGIKARKDLLIYYQNLSVLDRTLTGGRTPDEAFFAE
jgi:NitT/TauT family transport system substrate-binding protein